MPVREDARDLLFRLNSGFKRELKRQLYDEQMEFAPMQLRALRLIDGNQPCTVNRLSEIMVRDKAQIARLIKELEKNHCIRRIPNPDDGRSQLLELQPVGQQLVGRIKAVEQQITNRLFHELNDAEVDSFLALVRRIIGNLDQPSSTDW